MCMITSKILHISFDLRRLLCYTYRMSYFQKGNFEFRAIYSATTANDVFERHMHNAYELYYFIKGDADYIVGNTIYHLRPHDLLLIRPSVYHYLKLLSDAAYRRIVINFTEEELTDEVASVLSGLKTHYEIKADSLVNQYCNNCASIVDRYAETDVYPSLLRNLCLIITELKYSGKLAEDSVLPGVIHPILGEIIAYIDDNIDIPIDISVLSKRFFVSPSWIMHAFRKFLNISTAEYINRKKILYAQQLIAAGVSPTKAAEACGYKNYSTFFTRYKNIIGNTPIKSKIPKL